MVKTRCGSRKVGSIPTCGIGEVPRALKVYIYLSMGGANPPRALRLKIRSLTRRKKQSSFCRILYHELRKLKAIFHCPYGGRKEGVVEDKVEKAHRVLRLASDMSQHYYQKPIIICYSGGKDSDTILRLAMECLDPKDFEVMYSVTTVDSPVTTRHINNVFKECEEKGIKTVRHIPIGKDGKPTNMWKLIAEKGLPPTRLARYCCSVLKEASTPNRVAVLGVRGGRARKDKAVTPSE